jgi:hypothetical protein
LQTRLAAIDETLAEFSSRNLIADLFRAATISAQFESAGTWGKPR